MALKAISCKIRRERALLVLCVILAMAVFYIRMHSKSSQSLAILLNNTRLRDWSPEETVTKSSDQTTDSILHSRCQKFLFSGLTLEHTKSELLGDTFLKQSPFNFSCEKGSSANRYFPNLSLYETKSVLKSTWCGHELLNQNPANSSYDVVNEWIVSGGINVVQQLESFGVFKDCGLLCEDESVEGKNGNKNHSVFVYGINETITYNLWQIHPRLTTLERHILAQGGPETDFNKIASEHTSKIVLLNKPPKGFSKWMVGDSVKLRIDLYDTCNRRKRKGGDVLRAWIYSPSNIAGTPGRVHDLGNGSYIASLTLRWSGEQRISIALHHPKEIIRTGVFLRALYGTMRYITGAFENEKETEVTPCLWYPIIPGYRHVCNLTSLNGGLPWYCGKPNISSLDCGDWTRSQSVDYIKPIPVTDAERLWLRKMNKEPYVRRFTSSVIDLEVGGENAILEQPSTPCWKIPHSRTWPDRKNSLMGLLHEDIKDTNLEFPDSSNSGYFWESRWYSTLCNATVFTRNELRSWLKGKTIYFLGDSNLRKLYRFVKTDFCTVPLGNPQDFEPLFPSPVDCFNPNINLHVAFRAHAHPFNLPHPDHYRKHNLPLSHWLDGIRSREDVVIILHLYLHFAQFNSRVFIIHVEDTVRAVERLLQRNPRARIVVRGTHISYKGWPSHLAGGDFLAMEMDHILVQLFSHLRDRVMYLNAWDMALAVENLNFHPEAFVHSALLQQVYNHFIGR